jgi:hypothetical protein
MYMEHMLNVSSAGAQFLAPGVGQKDNQPLNPASGRRLTEPAFAASCNCRMGAAAPAGGQETRCGIDPAAANGRGESKSRRTPALARWQRPEIVLRAVAWQSPRNSLRERSRQRGAQCPQWMAQQWIAQLRPALLPGVFGLALRAPSAGRPGSPGPWVEYPKPRPAAPPGSTGSCGCAARVCACWYCPC